MSSIDELFKQFGVKTSSNQNQQQVSSSSSVSSSSNFVKPHDVRAVTSAMNDILAKDCAPPPIMIPSDSSSHPKPQFVKLGSFDQIQINRTTQIQDLESSLFAKWSDEKDDDDDEDVVSDKHNNTCSDSDSEVDATDGDFETITCKPCPPPVVPTSKRLKSTDNDLKNFAFDMSRMGMLSCNPSVCKLGGACIQKSTFEDMRQMVNDFWGNHDDCAPSSKTRQLLILNILRSAYRPDEDDFHFYAGNKMKNNRRVCEAAYLILLGLSNNPNASAAPRQWINLRKYVKSGAEAAGISYASKKPKGQLMKSESKKQKTNSAKAFILMFGRDFGDTIPGPEGGLDVYVVPFTNVSSFHVEYLQYKAHQQANTEEVARIGTFRSAFLELEKEGKIKLLKAKGAFQTCEICNNASELLMNKHRNLKHSQREVIQKFRQLHLTQQSKEREFLDHRKLQAAKVDDAGNPLRLFLFSDGFTIYTCNTPRFATESKGDKVIETRIVGTEVICGPIKTVLVYRTDAMVGGGANSTIELMRQAMIDTSILLRKRGLLMPRTLWLQFDNCGDQKNKEFFCYSSLLIELFAFDEVEIAFLIVGHTHASIDQYFSVIAKAIRRTHFIGTPLALLELIRRCHDASWHQKAIIREIKVYYDLREMFKPYLNTRIKYFTIPHVFRFTPYFGHVAIMQYQNFSTNKHFMPPQPTVPISCMASLQKAIGTESVQIQNLAIVDGTSRFTEFLGLGTSSSSSSSATTVAPKSVNEMLGKSDKIELLRDVNALLTDLESLSIRSIQQQEARMNDEAEGVPVKEKYNEVRKEIQQKMMKENSATEGFIIWLDLAKRKELPPLQDITPQAFDPADGLDRVSDILSELRQEEDELEQQQNPKCPSFKRKKTSESTKQQESKAAVLKRQIKGAKAIASTCQWILQQVELKRIRRTFDDEFDPDHFSDTHLTNVEIKWLEDNNTLEKVLSISCHAYATAPKWEAYPKATLSEADMIRIEQEKQRHMKAVEDANDLGRSLLVRIGENASENEHIIEYGKGSTAWIKEQLCKKRGAKKNKTSTTSAAPAAPAAAETLASSTSVTTKESRCAVEECTEKPIEGFCADAECVSRRFCDLHLTHTSHANHRLRTIQEELEQLPAEQSKEGRKVSGPPTTSKKTSKTSKKAAPAAPAAPASLASTQAAGTTAGTALTANSSSAGIAPTENTSSTLSSASNSSVLSGAAAINNRYRPVFNSSASSTVPPPAVEVPVSSPTVVVSSTISAAVLTTAKTVPAAAVVVAAAAAASTAGSAVIAQTTEPAAQVVQTGEETSVPREGNINNNIKVSSKLEGMTETTLDLGKATRELHAKIVSMVTIVEATKQRDFSGRLLSELVFTQYINPIAVLCIEVYKLEIPQLLSTRVQELISSTTVVEGGIAASDRDYKRAIFEGSRISNKGLQEFVKAFVDAFVSKYCL